MASRFGNGSPNSTTDPIGGTTDDQLFQSELYGETITFNVPVENGDYDIELHFVEMYQTANGSRIFSANVEGDSVFSDLDLYMTEGHDEAYTVRVSDLAVDDEEITITLTSSADNATISGISVYSSNGAYREPPLPPPLPPSNEVPGADCDVTGLPNPNSLQNNPNLPDPFIKLDGTRISDKSEWRCRRQEILEQAYGFIYGEKPGITDSDTVSGSVTSSRISVSVQHNGNSLSFNNGVSVPSGSGPFPAVIAYSMAAGMRSVLNSMGVAVIDYSYADVVPYQNNLSGPFFRLYNGNSSGQLAAWAWGVSRIIDVIEANPGVIDPQRIGVTGCSFAGKAAFAAGALDGRIALTMPVESGVGGIPALRLIPDLDPEGEQPPHATSGGFMPWLSPANFGPHRNNTDRLPVDMHQVIGLIAPRGLYAMDNHGGLQYYKNLDVHSAYASIIAGKEIYKALGAEDSISYVSENIGHCSWTSAFEPMLRANVNRFLLDQPANTGTISQGPVRVNVDSWIDWTTPTLSGSLED